MKRVLLLVAALFMVAGAAQAQTCLSLSGRYEGWVEMVLTIDEEQVDIWHIAFWDLGTPEPMFDFDEDTEGESRWLELPGDPDLLTSEDWHIEYAPSWAGWFAYEDADPAYEGTFGDGVDAGGVGDGDCEFGGAEPEPTGPSAAISGPHTVETGTSPVVLTAAAEGFDEDPAVTYEWDDASTGDTRTLVGLGDGAYEYSVVASGNVGGDAATAEAAFALWVGLATPLAGGLGLGLLAGACALAGAVSIRRKK